MNDFDKFLDQQLRKMLDAIVATQAPPRGSRRPRAEQPLLAVEGPIETGASGAVAPEANSVLEPMAVTSPIPFPAL